MIIKPHVVSISQTAIFEGIWRIEKYLFEKYGATQAEIDIDPLRWYIFSGRASLEFIRLVLNAKPFMIARKLHTGGSYEETIEHLKKYLKYDNDPELGQKLGQTIDGKLKTD